MPFCTAGPLGLELQTSPSPAAGSSPSWCIPLFQRKTRHGFFSFILTTRISKKELWYRITGKHKQYHTNHFSPGVAFWPKSLHRTRVHVPPTHPPCPCERCRRYLQPCPEAANELKLLTSRCCGPQDGESGVCHDAGLSSFRLGAAASLPCWPCHVARPQKGAQHETAAPPVPRPPESVASPWPVV